MKKTLIFATILMFANITLSAQKSMKKENTSLQVKEYKLKNGLTVMLNEDHTQPNVFGAVVVKGGSNRDPKDATGIAHYFEHIMFKGTDQIGTVNYKEEKIYLDSIKMK